MRRLSTLGLIALVLAGCADGRVIVTVDVMSFIDPADRQVAYGPIPGGLSGTVQSPVQTFEILDGVGGSTILDSVRVSGSADVDNATGSGTFIARIYFDSLATPYSGAPAIVVNGTVSPGQNTVVTFDEELSPAARRAFTKPQVFVGVEVEFQSTDPLPTTSLEGTVIVRALLARLVAREDIF
jgi:hypothetical protein